jgi:circadian clock protein KaiC
LLSGGVERGTVTLITGTSGTGKTSLGMQFIKEAYSRGERSIVFTFEEESEILLKRCESIGIPARTMAEAGKLKIYNIPLFNFDFNELAMMIIDEIENKNTCLIMIDSITSYYQNVQNKNDVIKQIKVLGSFLKECGAALFIISTSSKIIENTVMSEFGVSALADNIIFLSYMEIRGEMRKTIGVLKKRLSDFENTLREFKITRNGIEVGQPLTNYRGILSGIPEEIK